MLVFVASDRARWCGALLFERQLRYALYSAREVCRWPHRIMVIDVGLTDAQRDTLNAHDIMVVPGLHGTTEELNQPFMWKIWVDLKVVGSRPIIVADADLEFRDPGVLQELLELAESGRFFIAAEPQRWHFPMARTVPAELRESLMYVQQEYGFLAGTPILNAGLFGGPRPLFDGFVKLARMCSAATLPLFTWFWEQLALSYLCHSQPLAGFVEILPSTYNWIPTWGDPELAGAKIVHFTRDKMADRRMEIPADYLLPRLHRWPDRPRSEGLAGPRIRGAKVAVAE